MFQCSSASRKFLNSSRCSRRPTATQVSVLFSEPKIPQSEQELENWANAVGVSVLFSEPKIPQCRLRRARSGGAEVSVLFSEPKIPQSERARSQRQPQARFQCSSASRKFLNGRGRCARSQPNRCFSALQRAENSSMSHRTLQRLKPVHRFSALQRAENSSMESPRHAPRYGARVSVLFSEPKIPQW